MQISGCWDITAGKAACDLCCVAPEATFVLLSSMSSATVLVATTGGESGVSSDCGGTDVTADDLAVEESSGGSGCNLIRSFPCGTRYVLFVPS